MSEFLKNHYGYLILLVFSIITTFLSIIIEFNHPVMDDSSHIKNMFNFIIYRIIHYYIIIYNSLFLILFKLDGIDSVLYLLFNLVMNIQWTIMGCCWLSFFELNEYSNINYRNFDTTFNPFMYVLFRQYSSLIMKMVGILIIITIAFILSYNKWIPFHFKILYIVGFSYSIYVCSNGENPLWEWINNIDDKDNVSMMKKIIEKAETYNKYPTEDHFLFKHLCDIYKD